MPVTAGVCRRPCLDTPAYLDTAVLTDLRHVTESFWLWGTYAPCVSNGENGAPEGRMRPVRRRGQKALREAVHHAVLAELAENGLGGLTIEGVAARAQAAKTSIYRHWPDKQALVIDALRDTLPTTAQPPNTGSVRGDFLAMLQQTAAVLDSPIGPVLRDLFAQRDRHPQIVALLISEVIERRQRLMLEALQQAAGRGEIAAGAVSLMPVLVGTGLVMQHRFQHGRAPTEAECADYVDRGVLPVLGVRPQVS